jgi:hypothetical protein
MLKVPFVIDS